ncbi:MAG: DsrE family protein [Thermaerobacter sp.]|nr:DsrE family protein [Thermaerobacter sp.]
MPSVLFHVNEPEPSKHRAVLKSIGNLLAEMPEAVVELVVQGEAIPMVVAERSTVVADLQDLQGRGLLVAVCRNTMVAKGVQASQLLPGSMVVPSAVGELVNKQAGGAAYVKL